MAIEPGTLVFELLRGIRGDMAEMRTGQREQRGLPAAVERSLAHVQRGGAEQRAETGVRFDRVLDRLERIESRLDLRDG